jgi:hypothetical protein
MAGSGAGLGIAVSLGQFRRTGVTRRPSMRTVALGRMGETFDSGA